MEKISSELIQIQEDIQRLKKEADEILNSADLVELTMQYSNKYLSNPEIKRARKEAYDLYQNKYEYKEALDEAYTNKLKEYTVSFYKLQEMVETTVDLEALDRHEFIIKSEFDDGLRIIRKKINKITSDIETEHRRVCDDLNQDPEKKLLLENHRVHGWSLRLTRNEAGCIRNKKQYQEISTQKNGVYFTTSTLMDLRREYDQQAANYTRKQGSLVAEVVQVAASYVPVLEQLATILAHLDVIISLAHVS